MARARDQSNGHLQEALEALIQSQATLLQNQASFLAQKTGTDRQSAFDGLVASMGRCGQLVLVAGTEGFIEHADAKCRHGPLIT